jgi:hypothetical protein
LVVVNSIWLRPGTLAPFEGWRIARDARAAPLTVENLPAAYTRVGVASMS